MSLSSPPPSDASTANANNSFFYSLSGVASDGTVIRASEFRGKVVYATNVASMWGETLPGYARFERLARRYGPDDLAILAFPSREYANEEYGTDEAIRAFAAAVGFPFGHHHHRGGGIGHLMRLGSVKGESAPAIWRYLRDVTGSSDPSWNFSSAYLVSRSGKITRCASPETAEAEIAALMTAEY